MSKAKFLFIGGQLDGKIVQLHEDDTMFYHKIFPRTDNAIYLENPLPKPIEISIHVYKKAFVRDGDKKAVFFAIEGTLFSRDLMRRVLELTSKL